MAWLEGMEMAEDGKIGQAKTEWWREFIRQV